MMNTFTCENRDIRKLSIKLRNCLNLIGGSEDFIRYRISCFKSMEAMYGIANVGNACLNGFYIGSQMEGGAMLGVDSDADMMFIDKEIIIITDVEKYRLGIIKENTPERRKYILPTKRLVNPPLGLIIDADVTPGYAKVMALDSKTLLPVSRSDECTLSHLFEEDENGTFYFSHEKWKDRISLVTPSRYKHGPALTEDSANEFRSSDFVYGLKSSFWPKSADEWITRERSYQWPTHSSIELTKRGCFLVPVGPTPGGYSTEWRLSFTLLERQLIWTWTNIQYQCFMLMKVIKREVIEMKIPDVISSYHLKTIMFWMSEERPVDFWKKENFHICIEECLNKLVEFVERGNCPNYFIRANNLFKSKFSVSTQKDLIKILRQFIRNFWTDVFRLPTIEHVLPSVGESDFDFFTDLQTSCLKNTTLLTEVLHLHFSVLISFATSAMKPAFQLIYDQSPEIAISKHEEYLNLISDTDINDEETKRLVQALCDVVYISLGGQWFAKSYNIQCVEERKRIVKLSEDYIRKGSELDTSFGKLKLATLNFALGDLDACLRLTQKVLSNENVISVSGFEPDNPDNVSMVDALRILHWKPDITTEIREHCALDVVFLPSEATLAPRPVQFEIGRAIAAGKYSHLDDPLMWVSIDAKFYALMLKFLVAHKQQEILVRDTALSAMRAYVAKRSSQFVNKVMALNITGYCLQLVGEIDWSIDVFLGSIILQRSHNAAYWHLALLVWNEWKKYT